MTRFIDQATIEVSAGRGGKGCHSFYKDLWTRHPIPDGGDGGSGGQVIVRATPQQTTLLDFQTRRHFRGGPGGNGFSKRRHGARGTNCLIEVPLGTILWDAQTGDLICELLRPGEEEVLARGGAGGIGNASWSKTRGAPRKDPWDSSSMEGAAGERRRIRLELKLVADVGIVGMPNAGKSTLLGQISSARPKVAAFPFTTTHPVLGAVGLSSQGRVVAVDVPGLIEGAHRGKGLGLEFLRHIERTRILVHLIDMAGVDQRDPVEDYRTLNAELKAYQASVSAKPQIVVANKMDEPAAKENLIRFRKKVKIKVLSISAKTGAGVPMLLQEISRNLKGIQKGLL